MVQAKGLELALGKELHIKNVILQEILVFSVKGVKHSLL